MIEPQTLQNICVQGLGFLPIGCLISGKLLNFCKCQFLHSKNGEKYLYNTPHKITFKSQEATD